MKTLFCNINIPASQLLFFQVLITTWLPFLQQDPEYLQDKKK